MGGWMGDRVEEECTLTRKSDTDVKLKSLKKQPARYDRQYSLTNKFDKPV